MKQLNYNVKSLILMNVKSAEKPPIPEHFTQSQYRVLCKVIIQKKIQKRFFDFILFGLFGLTDWKKLDYSQMYTLIYVLSHYNYNNEKERI